MFWNDTSFKEFCSRVLSTACRGWFNSTATEGLVKVVYGYSFQSLWLQERPFKGTVQRRIFLGADTTWRHEEKCGIFKYQPPSPGADPEIFDRGGGGGGSKLWFRKDCWTFFYGKLLFSHKHHPSPSRRPRLHVIIPWPLTFYGCTRKGYIHPWNILLCERRSPFAREVLLCEQRRVPKNNHIF